MTDDNFSEDRLRILQKSDLERHWYTVDDKRVCILCEHIISGRDIRISGGPEEYSLACPTPGCPGNSTHWLLFRPASQNDGEAAVSTSSGLRNFFSAPAPPGQPASNDGTGWPILDGEQAR